MAVGEHVGQGELLQAGGPGGLDDAHVGDVVGGHGVKADGEPLHGARGVMGFQDGVGHGGLHASLGLFCRDQLALLPAHALVVNGNHMGYLLGSNMTHLL